MDTEVIRKSPEEWQAELNPPSWKHQVASICHHWPLHLYHAGEPIQLTREDYEGALEASATSRPPHDSAISQIVRDLLRI